MCSIRSPFLRLALIAGFWNLTTATQEATRWHRVLESDDDSSEAEWTYSSSGIAGEEPFSPSYWYLGYESCAGTMQSPIDLASESESNEIDLAISLSSESCSSSQLEFTADDHTWQVSFEACDSPSSVEFGGYDYNLQQMHIHSVSEHTVDGSHCDGEFHFVHYRDGSEDDLLVIAVLVESDSGVAARNKEVEKYWKVLRKGRSTVGDNVEFDAKAYDLLPSVDHFTHYNGSLTTPPCTEGVLWLVLDDTISMSTKQIEDYRSSVAAASGSKVDEDGNTNRPTQPLNDRILYRPG